MPVTIYIAARTPNRAKILGADEKLIKKLDHALSFEIQGSFWARRARGFHWDGRRHLFSKVTGGLPSGLISYAIDVLNKNKIEFKVVDERSWQWPRKVLPNALAGLTLADHQLKAIRAALVNRGGILRIATNGGKTACGAAFIKSLPGLNFLWVVPSRMLVAQTVERLQSYLPGVGIGRIQGGVWTPNTITVCTAASLIVKGKRDSTVVKLKIKRMSAFLKSIGGAVFDETHHGAAASWYRPLSNIKAIWKLGLSGTPLDRSDGKNLMVEALCGPIVSEVSAKELMKLGWSANTKIKIIEIGKPELNGMIPWQQAYKEGIVYNDTRNWKIYEQALHTAQSGQSVLILCREIAHVNLLADYCLNQGNLIEDQDFVKIWRGRDKQFKIFERGEAKIAIASPVLGEGIDLPGDRINVLINAEGLMSTIITLQKLGRGQRKKKTGKNELTVIDFADFTHPDLAKHSIKRIQDYEKEGYPIV